MKKNRNGHRGRAGAAPKSPLLPADMNGARYRVQALVVQAEVSEIDDDGKVARRFVTPAVAWYQKAFGLTAAEQIALMGLKPGLDD